MFLGASPNKYVQSENQKFLTYMYRYYAIPRQKNIVSIVRYFCLQQKCQTSCDEPITDKKIGVRTRCHGDGWLLPSGCQTIVLPSESYKTTTEYFKTTTDRTMCTYLLY